MQQLLEVCKAIRPDNMKPIKYLSTASKWDKNERRRRVKFMNLSSRSGCCIVLGLMIGFAAVVVEGNHKRHEKNEKLPFSSTDGLKVRDTHGDQISDGEDPPRVEILSPPPVGTEFPTKPPLPVIDGNGFDVRPPPDVFPPLPGVFPPPPEGDFPYVILPFDKPRITISPAPSESALPSQSPSVSNLPSSSVVPSQTPTASLVPSISAIPTPFVPDFVYTDVIASFGETSTPSISQRPSQTPSPSIFPSQSMQPSVTGKPTTLKYEMIYEMQPIPPQEPSVSPQPSESLQPSMKPSMSPSPTITDRPSTGMDYMIGEFTDMLGLYENLTTTTTTTTGIDTEPLSLISCYSDWNTLVEAVGSNEAGITTLGGGIYMICPNTTLDLTADGTNDTPLIVNTSKTIIQCGANGEKIDECLIVGGAEQIKITGSVEDVYFLGLTLIGSTVSGVNAAGTYLSNATFVDCEFSGHTGQGAIVDYDSSEVTLPERPANGSMKLVIISCVFQDNKVTFAPLTNLGGNVTVVDSLFNGNSAESGAIAVWMEGYLSLITSCFEGNRGSSFGGSIFLQTNSMLEENLFNYGKDNVAGAGDCTEVSLEGGDCEVFESDTCVSALIPTPPPTPAPTFTFECFNDLAELANAVGSLSQTNSIGVTYTVCPGTVFNFSHYDNDELGPAPPLLIDSGNMTMQCGIDGSRSNHCVFVGGSRHFYLLGSIRNVVIKGITMREGSDVSVVAELISPFSVEFIDCVWEENVGVSTVLILSGTADNDPGAEINPVSSTPSVSPQSGPTDGIDDDDLTDDILAGFGRDDAASDHFILSQCSFTANVVTDAVVVNMGATVEVTSCEFTDNKADEGSVIFTESGSAAVTSSCFQGNTQSEIGLVYGDTESSIDFESNFGANNSFAVLETMNNGCDGIFAQSTGVCSGFDSSVCSVLVHSGCLSYWKELYEAVNEATALGIGGVFTLCENTILDLAGLDSFIPIKIETENTVIQCGLGGSRSNNCTITGGATQFEINGGSTGIEFRGLTMSGSSVAAVNAAGLRSARATFTDCAFTEHKGLAAIINYDGTVATGKVVSRDVEADLPPPVDRSMNVEVKFCHFENNNVAYAPVTNLGGSVEVSDSRFLNNSGESGGVGVWFDGGASIVNSCFTGNVGTKSGSSYFAVDASLTLNVENFGEGNTGGDEDQCEYLFLAGGCQAEGFCEGICVEFTAPNCTAADAPTQSPTTAPSLAPSFDPPDCYSEWTELSTAIELGSQTFIKICENSILEVGDSSHITINRGITLQCGESDSPDSNCEISGGTTQFIIDAPTDEVQFSGITMSNSSLISVLASGGSTSGMLSFLRCEWKQNFGKAAVLVYNEEGGEQVSVATDIGSLESEDSMRLDFQFCSFKENTVTFAVVALVGGDAQFILSAFSSNADAKAGVISATSKASALVRDSCFVENSAQLSGVIFSDDGTTVTLESNFASNNIATASQDDTPCQGWFEEDSSICLELQVCSGECEDVSDVDVCLVEGFDYEIPKAPSTSPSPSAEIMPVAIMAVQDDDLKEQSFTSSTAFMVIMAILGIIIVGGIGAYFFCRRQSDGMELKDIENAGDDNENDGQEDEDGSPGTESRGLLDGFRGRFGRKNKESDSAEEGENQNRDEVLDDESYQEEESVSEGEEEPNHFPDMPDVA